MGSKKHKYFDKNKKEIVILFRLHKLDKAYRPNAHLLYIIMHYNDSII